MYSYEEFVPAKKMVGIREPVRYMDGSEVTYDSIKQRLEEVVEQYGIPVSVETAEMNYGIFGDKGVPCLVVVHPDHRDDYFKFCILKKEIGKTCTVEVNSYGKSTQLKREDYANNTKIFDGRGTAGTASGLLFGGAVGAGFAIGSAVTGIAGAGVKAIGKGINALLRNPNALESEKMWYQTVCSIFDSVIC